MSHASRLVSSTVRREIFRRAKMYRETSRLTVDFYRIRHKLFLPLPITEFPENLSSVRGFSDYPFAIWVLWELEERIFALGHAAEWDGETDAVARDLTALTKWQGYRQRDIPDLCLAHVARIFVRALEWNWLSKGLRRAIFSALRRLVDDAFAKLPALPVSSVPELVRRDERCSNIPTIGALGLSLAATCCRHPLAKEAQMKAKLMAELWLAWGELGHVEGISYDGYTTDFLLDWLDYCAEPVRDQLLAHPRLPKILEELCYLGAPERPENFAPLGDVEPFEMRFHYSFAAKFLRHRETRTEFSFPQDAEKFVRADALPYLSKGKISPSVPFGLQDAHYALTLNAGQVRAAVSWSHSKFGHMQPDWGSMVMAVGGEWLLSDPGYRQYLRTSERPFTVGSGSHNAPIINGETASVRPANRAYDVLNGASFRLDLGQTYAKWHGSFFRMVSIEENGRIVLEDHYSGGTIRQLDYHWHGHPDAAWHLAEGHASIFHKSGLRFTCEGHPIQTDELHRLKGSRGHLSIVKILRFARPRKNLRVRWIFEPSHEK